MSFSYNRIAGQSVERLAALSDGIFAVAMTLLVLDLHVPLRDGIRSEGDLWHAMTAMTPQIAMYMLSFITLGIFWVGQQTQINFLEKSHRSLAWIHLLFLFAVTLVPFSTRLLAEFPGLRTALLVYWANILLLGICLVSQLELRDGIGSPQIRHGFGCAPRNSESDRCGAGSVRTRCGALRDQHAFEHRVHFCRADLFCDRPAIRKAHVKTEYRMPIRSDRARSLL